MQWFGRGWNGTTLSRVCPPIDPPIGQPCVNCLETITATDSGVLLGELVAHFDCMQHMLGLIKSN